MCWTFLGKVVELHTQHYKDDFDIDKELIQNLAACRNGENEQLLWMSRTCGTYCLWERDVYLQDSHENKVWRFYHEQTKDSILAYAIQLDGIQDGKVTGCIWPVPAPPLCWTFPALSSPTPGGLAGCAARH